MNLEPELQEKSWSRLQVKEADLCFPVYNIFLFPLCLWQTTRHGLFPAPVLPGCYVSFCVVSGRSLALINVQTWQGKFTFRTFTVWGHSASCISGSCQTRSSLMSSTRNLRWAFYSFSQPGMHMCFGKGSWLCFSLTLMTPCQGFVCVCVGGSSISAHAHSCYLFILSVAVSLFLTLFVSLCPIMVSLILFAISVPLSLCYTISFSSISPSLILFFSHSFSYSLPPPFFFLFVSLNLSFLPSFLWPSLPSSLILILSPIAVLCL